MENNYSIWHQYQPGWVHPDFIPYMRFPMKDDQGNTIPINTWKEEGIFPYGPSYGRGEYPNGMIHPALIRKNWGLIFAKRFPDDPCPPGFVPVDPEPNSSGLDGYGTVGGGSGYCYPFKPEHSGTFYTDKAFIAKRQYWDSYIEPDMTSQTPNRVSESFDMRSVNPLSGNYTIYYTTSNGGDIKNNSRTKTNYGRNPTSDSYLA